MEREVRVGLIGTGAIAQIVHLPLLKDLPGVRVEAVCDIDDDKAAAIAKRLDIPHVFEYTEELFSSGTVDAVVICTPNPMHEEQVVAALDAGLHVLVERPLALDAAGARAAVEAAERADRTLMVAYNNRFRPDALGLKSFVSSGELGDIFTLHGTWFTRKVRPKRRTWRHQRSTGGGAFMDLGVQVLDLCLWMLDHPSAVSVCAHLNPGEEMEVEDSAVALVRLETGSTISVQVTWSLVAEQDRHHLRVFGSAGSASTQPLKVFKEVEQGVLDVTPQIAAARMNAYTASYREELRQFLACAMEHHTVPLPREQIELMRIATAVYESAEKEKEIQL